MRLLRTRKQKKNIELHGRCGLTEDEVQTTVWYYPRKDGKELDKAADTMRTIMATLLLEHQEYLIGASNFVQSPTSLPL